MAKAVKTTRRELLLTGLGTLTSLPWTSRLLRAQGGKPADALKISNRLSPKNRQRPRRPQTLYIVLHTTEGPEAGSLSKVWRRGETHYFVTRDGHVLRIIDRARIATHSGRSMWEGHHNIDDYAVGIEVVGYYDQDITSAQYGALRELLRQLKAVYEVPDQRVLTHSMVAYGRPNRFHRNYHRGRKRCGMIFARADVRKRLGLLSKPARDEDVNAGRLVVADRRLYRFLYAGGAVAAAANGAAQGQAAAAPIPAQTDVISNGWTAWDIARERYDSPDTTYVFPDGRRLHGDQIREWNKIPRGTRVLAAESDDEASMEGFLEIGKDGYTAPELAGAAYDKSTTIYFFPDGMIRTGSELKQGRSTRTLLDRLPTGTRVLVGYIYGGHVQIRRPAPGIAGIKWNYPSTFYRYPDGRIVSGDEIDRAAIPARTLIFYQN